MLRMLHLLMETRMTRQTRMTRHQLDRARDLRAGCVYLAYSQRTGALRGVYRAEEAGIDGEGWATVCEDHGTLVLSDTRALALASDTDDFCDDCREEP